MNLVETTVDGHVALCRLDRPEARNALSPEVMEELASAVEAFDADDGVRCVVIAGSDEVFASGADIGALRDRSFQESLGHPSAAFWRRLAVCRTPLVAAVSGWALGGGCELALAGRVAERPPIAVRLAKQAVLAAEETSLSAGLETERRLYELSMATEDRVEGMEAFLEKRKPEFRGR
jgi:enoyl-CoA hydratase/carnithine racemase